MKWVFYLSTVWLVLILLVVLIALFLPLAALEQAGRAARLVGDSMIAQMHRFSRWYGKRIP